MPMKHTKYWIIHAIQTGIYTVLLILMSCIKDKNSDDKVFMAFYGFLVVTVMICVFIAIVAACIRGNNDEE